MATIGTNIVSILLVIFCIFAGSSKFGSWLDAFFLPHSFMVDVYLKVGSKLGQNSDMLRYIAGSIEFIAALLLINVKTRKFGAALLSFVMCFACLCHILLEDPLPAFIVPGFTFLMCGYLISVEKLKYQPKKKN